MIITKGGVSTYYHAAGDIHYCFDEFFSKLPMYEIGKQCKLIEALQRQIVNEPVEPEYDETQWMEDFEALRDVTPLFIIPDFLEAGWVRSTSTTLNVNDPNLTLVEFDY